MGTSASSSATAEGADDGWNPVCAFVALPVERGVTALAQGTAVALFRTYDDRVYALGNHDPLTRAGVLAKGIVGMRGDVPFVASPVHRKAFDLRSGHCLDDPHVSVPSYPVRIVDGTVYVGPRLTFREP
jgi:nitrite reductase (NADH) small subunit